MNKMIAGLFAAMLMGTSLVMADVGAPMPASKDLKKIIEEGPYVETSQRGITLSGYVDAGYIYNFAGRGSGNVQAGNLFSHRPATEEDNRGDFDLNAMKLALEKPLSDANELQAGFRVDLMMGEDVGSLGGTNDAGGIQSDDIMLEQAYVQFRLPYGNGIDFKVGKFVTILGYEVVERPVNMNITYGNIFSNLIPVWHTGFLSAYQVNDIVDLKFGVVNGMNNDNGIGNDSEDNAAILAAVNLTAPSANANWYNAVMYSINSEGAGAFDDAPVVMYDTYINWTPKFAKDKLLLGFNANVGTGAVTTNTAGIGLDDANYTSWWGWALYAKYKFTDIFSLASRIDYIHNDDSAMFGNDPAAGVDDSEDIWSYTATASFDVIENMMLRTEYRLDWGDDVTLNGTGGAADGTFSDGPVHTGAVQVVYSF